MKKTFALLATTLLAAAVFAAVEVGKPAPDFTGMDINGKTVRLSDYKGKIVVIESYNSDCPFCRNQYKSGANQELQKQLTAKGVVWLLVNSVNPQHPNHRTTAQAKQEWNDMKIAATTWIDDSSGEIGRLYGMKTTPHCFVVAPDGMLAYAGAIDNKPDPTHDPKTARNYVREAVDALLAGKPVEVAQTRPYGCSVKF